MSASQREVRPTKVDNLDVDEVPDGYIAYRAEKEMVYFLNATAAFVFELCTGAYSAAEIEQIFLTAFEGAETDVETVRECLDSLRQQGLLVC